MKQTDWYKDAIIYQIYPRSFCDGNDDGLGDIPGIISKFDYLKELGVNCVYHNNFVLIIINDLVKKLHQYKVEK